MTRILIVDDNAVDLKLQSEVLRLDGFLIERAVDAATALALLAGTLPDVILMDIGLPGTDGLTLTRLIKANARLMHVPVVALTAFAMKGDERMAAEAGCDGYITKPIDTRRFAEQVKAMADRAALRACGRPPD